MNELIQNYKLNEFIKIATDHNIDFARIIHDCYAYEFLENGFEKPYLIKPEYLEELKHMGYKYFVAFILRKSYVMYEVDNIGRLWVSYTEVPERNKGYITMLLKYVKERLPKKDIVGHTHNKSLRKILKSLGIRLHGE
jgi:hypothetical protein